MPTLEYKQTALMLQIEVMEGTLCYTKKEGGQWCSMPTAFVVLKHIMIQPFQKQHYITAMQWKVIMQLPVKKYLRSINERPLGTGDYFHQTNRGKG